MKAFKSIALGVTALGIAVALPATAFAGYFPADRPTYTCITPTNCPGADHVVFNSFTNNPVVGDERPFFAGSLNGANVQDRIKVKNGDVIVLRAYVHNNADPAKIGKSAAIARNVKMKVLIPTASLKDQNLVSFISASNANPGTINDTMSLYGDNNFTLEYVAGSAKFDHKADGVNMVSEKLNDTIVKDGTYLGDIHGCFEYSGYVTLQVKVNMPTTPVTTPETPKETPKTTPAPTKLPETGAGSVAAAVAAATVLGAALHRRAHDLQRGGIGRALSFLSVRRAMGLASARRSGQSRRPSTRGPERLP